MPFINPEVSCFDRCMLFVCSFFLYHSSCLARHQKARRRARRCRLFMTTCRCNIIVPLHPILFSMPLASIFRAFGPCLKYDMIACSTPCYVSIGSRDLRKSKMP